MTTNIMFLRDMKTMMKRDVDGIRYGEKSASVNSILMGRKYHTYASQVPYLAGLNTILAKAMLLTLLFLTGGMANGAWADDYKFVIINNKGNEALNYTISTSTLRVHAKARSIFAENFRFYTDKSKAQADAAGTIGTEGTDYFLLGANIGTGTGDYTGTFYVRYDAVSSPAIKIDGSQWYKMQVRTRTGAWYYIYYDTSDNKLKYSTSDSGTFSYMWKFSSDNIPDPYDIYITNCEGTKDISDGTVTIENVSTSNKQTSASYKTKIENGSYNQTASPTNLQSFVFTQGETTDYQYNSDWTSIWSTSYHIIGAYNGIDYSPKNGNPTGDNEYCMYYYFCLNNTGEASNAVEFWRSWRAEDPSTNNISQIKLTEVETQNCTFRLVDSNGNLIETRDNIYIPTGDSAEDYVPNTWVSNTNIDIIGIYNNSERNTTNYSVGSSNNEFWVTCSADFTFHVREQGSEEDVTSATATITNFTTSPTLSANLQREYCQYTYYYFDGVGTKTAVGVNTYQDLLGLGITDIYAYFTLSSTCPIVFSPSYEAATWYNIRFSDQNADTAINDYNKGNGLQWFQYFTPSTYAGQIWTNVKNLSDNPIESLGNTRAYFAFIGNPYAFKVINLYGGSSKSAQLDGDYIKIKEGEAWWTWDAPTSTGHFKIVLPETYANNEKTYWNCANANYENNARINYWTTSNDTRDIFVQLAPARHVFHVLRGVGGEEVDAVSVPISVGDPLVSPYALNKDTERPYCTFTEFYSDAACQNLITGGTFPAGVDDIYTPFEVDAVRLRNEKHVEFSSSFENAKWINLAVAGRTGNWLQPTLSDKKLRKNDSADGTECQSQFAFIGDPYAFRIVSRELGNGYDLQSNGGTGNTSELLFKEGTSNNIWTIFHPAGSQSDRFRLQMRGTDYNLMWDSDNPVVLYHVLNTNNDEKAQTGIFTYHVITWSGKDVIRSAIVADDALSSTTLAMPDVLKRKFISEYKLYYLDPSDGTTRHYLTQTDAQKTEGLSSDNYQTLVTAGVSEIYVDYVVSGLPFTPCTSYADADERGLWYNMHMGDDSKWVYNQKYNSSWNAIRNDLDATADQRTNDALLFAFIGDPYELKIINRYSGGDYYLGVASGSGDGSNMYYSSTINSSGICTWEIIDRSSGSYNAVQFALREFKTVDNPRYVWASGGVLRYKTSEDIGYGRTWVVKAPVSISVTYEVHDAEGNKLFESTITQTEGAEVSLPDNLRRMACNYTYRKGSATGDVISIVSESMTVYVTYSVDNTKLPFQMSTDFANAVWYNMQIPSYGSDKWLYLDSGGKRVQSKNAPSDLTAPNTYFAFAGDPYNLHIYNMQAGNMREAQWGGTDAYSVLVEFLPQDASGQWGLLEPLSAGDGLFSVIYQPTTNNPNPCYITGSTGLMNITNTRSSGAIEDFSTRNEDADLHVVPVTKNYYSISYKVYDAGANLVVEKADYYEGGDDISVSFPEILRRAYCNYSVLFDTFDGTSVFSNSGATVPTTMPTHNLTYYVQYTLTEKGTIIFSTIEGEAAPLHIKAPRYSQSDANYYITSNASGSMDFPGTYDTNSASDYEWKFIGTPYGFRILNTSSGKYLKTPSRTSNAVLSADGTLEDDIYWEADTPFNNGHETTLMLKDTWKDRTTPWFVYPNNHYLVSESKKNHLDIVTETSNRYTYHIIDNSGRIAIKYTLKDSERQFPNISLDGAAGHAAIPSTIYSPYIADESLTFYSFDGDYSASKLVSGNVITKTPASGTNIYVKYTLGNLGGKSLHLGGARSFEMKVNGNYVFEDGGSFNSTNSTDGKDDRSHLWKVIGGDPYAVQIENVESGNYITHATETTALGLQKATTTNTYFILKDGKADAPTGYVDQLELMAATGNSVDAGTAYYNVGRYDDVHLYGSNTYIQGDDVLQVLFAEAQLNITYCIVDKQDKVVLEATSNEVLLGLPSQWKSPLVNEYHYYKETDFIHDPASDTYVLDGTPEELDNPADAPNGKIYVTYDVKGSSDPDYIDLNEEVKDYTARVARSATDGTQVRDASKFGTMYLLQFHDGVSFRQEKGDELLKDATKAVYPYTNGDGMMYVYGEEQWTAQQNDVATTRTRWPWFLLSPNNDPYHVMVTSWQTSHNLKEAGVQTNYYAFMRTYYNATLEQVITTNISDDPRVRLYNETTNPKGSTAEKGGSDDNVPTEYMLLGTTGNYKLTTTYAFDHDGIAGTPDQRATVHSFEQYWKNNKTVQIEAGMEQHSGAPGATEKETLATKHPDWHEYDAWASAVRWTGGSRVFEYTTHWFQTIEMGETFDLIPTQLDAALVLLDMHGWEIMRKPISKEVEATAATNRNALKQFDSPMVKAYHFWKTGSKANGYHKYTVSNQVADDGTLTSLTQYPINQYNSNGTLADLYVTYEVKDEYAQSYTGAASEDDTKASYFLIKQNGTYAQTTDGTSITTTDVPATAITTKTLDGLTDGMYWYVKPNYDIDIEMGYHYSGEPEAVNGEDTRENTETSYFSSGKNGFDPYNLRIQSKAYPTKFFTTNATDADFDGTKTGMTWESTYSGASGVSLQEISTAFTATGHDATTLNVSNATFMAVQDANGNMRLMPRFDHNNVLGAFTAVEAQAEARPNNDQSGRQTTLLRRPIEFLYVIVDHSGREALRWKSAFDDMPTIPTHFKSPMAKEFKFYKSAIIDSENTVNDANHYTIDESTTEVTSTDEIRSTDTYVSKGITTQPTNTIYIRYKYDDTADATLNLVRGNWLTAKLNAQDVQKDDAGIVTGTLDNASHEWMWKFRMKDATIDPYALQIINHTDLGTAFSTSTLNGTLLPNNTGTYQRFAILNHASGGYALTVAGTADNDHYYFISGASLPATLAEETSFSAKANTYDGTRSQWLFSTDIEHTFRYKLITNSGKVVLQDEVSNTDAAAKGYEADMPAWMKTPLMTSDAYTYYTHADGSDSEGYSNFSEPTTTLAGIDDDIIYVRYDYSKSAKATSLNSKASTAKLNLSGTVPYFFYFNNIWLAQYESGRDGSIRVKNEHLKYSDTPLWYFSGNDPYEIEISNPYFGENLYLSTQVEEDIAVGNEGKPDAKMRGESDTDYPHHTFMVLTSGSGSSLALYVTGSQVLSLIEEGGNPYNRPHIRVYKDDTNYKSRIAAKTNAGNNNQGNFSFIPAVVYHVITNNGKDAITCASDYTDYDEITIPAPLHSPLLNLTDYKYYTKATKDASGKITVDTGSEIPDKSSFYEQTDLGVGDVYIRYTYNRSTSPKKYPNIMNAEDIAGLDLSGNTWYTMVNYSSVVENKPVYNKVVRVITTENNLYDDQTIDIANLKTSGGISLSSKTVMWRLEGDDPYAIIIRNAEKGNNKFVCGRSNSDVLDFAEDGNESGIRYTTFMYLTTSCSSNTSIAKDDLGGTFVPTGYVGDNRTFNYNNVNQIKLWQWSNLLQSHLGVNANTGTNNRNSWISFYKAPVTRKYHYHAYNQATGKWTWDAILEHDWLTPVVLDDQIARLYSKYEQEYLTSGAVSANTFKTRAELEAIKNAQFYSNEGMTERVFDEDESTHAKTYDVYPAYTEESDGSNIPHIYFKYQVDTDTEIDGKKFGALFTVDDGAETAAEKITADVATHLAHDGLYGQKVKANWQFMVLDTDKDLTRDNGEGKTVGEQYFLRREDDGNISWLNGPYKLYPDEKGSTSRNYPKTVDATSTVGYSYTRVAETVRTGTNEPFREGRWLWTFTGDPYDVKVLNFEAVRGVVPRTDEGYTLAAKADSYVSCWTNDFAGLNSAAGSAFAAFEDSKTVFVPQTDTTSVSTQWGLCAGSDGGTFRLMASEPDKTSNSPRYWQMSTTAGNLQLSAMASDQKNSIKTLPYVPTRYEDVILAIRRKDACTGNAVDMNSGSNEVFYAASDRMFSEGDQISKTNIPMAARRKFCEYTIQDSEFGADPYDASIEGGTYTVIDGSELHGLTLEQQRAKITDDGKYTEAVKDGEHIVAQAMYVSYRVTTNMFIYPSKSLYALRTDGTKNADGEDYVKTKTERTAELERMIRENDHVFFMDFLDKDDKGDADTYHGYYHTYHGREGETKETEDRFMINDTEDTGEGLYRHLHSDNDRMVSQPENLKWYFVGDPYKLQVFCANVEALDENLSRIVLDTNREKDANDTNLDPDKLLTGYTKQDKCTEWQFVHDCVNLRNQADPTIDNRPYVQYREYNSATGEYIQKARTNPNKGQLLYPRFYWQVVSAQSDDPEAFALRYVDEETPLSYRGVYYYLHRGYTEVVEDELSVQKRWEYKVDLKYNAGNDIITDNATYFGYHTANEPGCAIKLVQPARVFVSVYKGDETSDANRVTQDELTEYYGVGESITDMPRQIRREYADYYNLTNRNNSDIRADLTSGYELTTARAHQADGTDNGLKTCEQSSNCEDLQTNHVYQFDVHYKTSDDAPFMAADIATLNAMDLKDITWYDLNVGTRWLTYDQTNVTGSANKKQVVNKEGNWAYTKRFHWAFVGDPYSFQVVNRRLYEDSRITGDANTRGWLTIGTSATATTDPTGKNENLNKNVTDYTGYLTLGRQNDTPQSWSMGYRRVDFNTSGTIDATFLRTADPKTTGPWDTSTTGEGEDKDNATNNYLYVYLIDENGYDGQRQLYFPKDDGDDPSDGTTDNTSYFLLRPYSLYTRESSARNSEGSLDAKTSYSKEVKMVGNDCFDARIFVFNEITGQLMHFEPEVEVRYGTATDGDIGPLLPATVKRYGCEYKAYYFWDKANGQGLDDSNNNVALTGFTDEAAVFDHLDKDNGYDEDPAFDENSKVRINLYVTYSVKDKVTVKENNADVDVDFASLFSSEDDLKRDELGWVNSYFQWSQTYSGTSYTYTWYTYEDDKSRPIYGKDGAFMGYEKMAVAHSEPRSGGSTTNTLNGYMNAKTTTTAEDGVYPTEEQAQSIYGDERTIDDTNEQKWAFIGDPYSFQLTNYTYYDSNHSSMVTGDGTSVSLSGNATSHWTLKVDANGTPYLALLSSSDSDPAGTIESYATFDRVKNNVDQHWSQQFVYLTGGESNDPTGQALNANGAKPFYLRALASYANFVVYHLIIGHKFQQMNYDHPDDFLFMYDNTTPDTEGKTARDRALDVLKKHIDEIATYADKGAKATSLRDLVRCPIEDYTVEKVGVGNKITLPWYMKREFCNYSFYQQGLYTANGTESGGSGWTLVDGSDTHAPLTTILPEHKGRMLVVDVVYNIDETQFRFAVKGRRTTRWYQMMTQKEEPTSDGKYFSGLMNFSYKDGISARFDRSEHYTNNYLWSPVGDPYGFVLHNRYATINGTGWNSVVITTGGHLPKKSNIEDDRTATASMTTAARLDYLKTKYTTWSAHDETVQYTGRNSTMRFVDGRVVHLGKDETRKEGDVTETTDGPMNAVYEMMCSNYDRSFLIHPTADYIDPLASSFDGFYMKHEHKTEDGKTVHRAALQWMTADEALRDKDANWRLETTPEQLVPYFERSGYVGGLKSNIASQSQNKSLYNQLKAYEQDPLLTRDYNVMEQARNLVYGGKFVDASDPTKMIVKYPRDNTFRYFTGSENIEMTDLGTDSPAGLGDKTTYGNYTAGDYRGVFQSKNLEPMRTDYFRIKAMSENALDRDGRDVNKTGVKGIVGPRYISGYRHLSEKTATGEHTAGYTGGDTGQGRWLHFYETDEANTTFHTFAELNTMIDSADDSGDNDRRLYGHPALAGNIEILPVEYDPASIFHFTPKSDDGEYGRWTFGTQGLWIEGKAAAEGTADHDGAGFTRLIDAAAHTGGTQSSYFRIDDIGGAAVTLRLVSNEDGSSNWDALVGENIKTNYLCIDARHRYRITVHTDNELKEIGDHADNGYNGIQDTKWLLQPVRNAATADEYRHDMPLRLQVYKGGKDIDLTADDPFSYASLYLPFDARLSVPTDVAFTYNNTGDPTTTDGMRMTSVSITNQMGNGQMIFQGWPVVVRTNTPKTGVWKAWSAPSGDDAVVTDGPAANRKSYVELYLPNTSPSGLSYPVDGQHNANMKGEYLEQDLTGTAGLGNNLMVFGLPFTKKDKPHADHEYNTDKHVGFYTNENWAREAAPTVTARSASDSERSNSYVYANKIYYNYTKPSSPSRYIIALFDDEELPDDRPISEDVTGGDTPWPCDVYDLQGRRVAENEAPYTLRRNHPALPKGVYVFGGRKVVVR